METMTDHAFQDFLAESNLFLKTRVAKSQDAFNVNQYERYDYDLLSGRFWWSDAGVTKVEATLIPVGSISTESNTWLWAWANPYFNGVSMVEIERVRAFGEEHGIEKLKNPKWAADECDGWEMTAIAARLLDSDSAYRSPSRTGFLFLLLIDLHHVFDQCA
jgi:hypothetical protein